MKGKKRKRLKDKLQRPQDVWTHLNRNADGEFVVIENIREHLQQTIVTEKERCDRMGLDLEIAVGSDSQVHGKVTLYGTVIVFLRTRYDEKTRRRTGAGGFFFVKTTSQKTWHQKAHGKGRGRKITIKERMMEEVNLTIQSGFGFTDVFDKLGVPFEVHIDINQKPEFKSNRAYAEAVGYALGMGMEVKTKPEAFGATYAAGKVVS